MNSLYFFATPSLASFVIITALSSSINDSSHRFLASREASGLWEIWDMGASYFYYHSLGYQFNNLKFTVSIPTPASILTNIPSAPVGHRPSHELPF